MYSAGGYLQQPSSKVISKQFLDEDKESLRRSLICRISEMTKQLFFHIRLIQKISSLTLSLQDFWFCIFLAGSGTEILNVNSFYQT